LSCKDFNAYVSTGTCKCNEAYAALSTSPLTCGECQDATFKNGDTCEACHATCLKCSGSSTSCQSCIENAEIIKGDCQCKTGYSETEGGCSRTLSFSLSVTSKNVIVLSFSQELPAQLTQADLTLTIEGLTDFTFVLEQLSLTQWQITLSTTQQIDSGTPVTVLITNPELQLDNQTASGSLTGQSAPKTAEEKQAAAIGAVAGASSTTAVSASTAGGFATGSMSSAWGMINNIQIIGYIPMMNINLPLALSSFFTSVLDFNLVPNVFENFQPDDSPKNIKSARKVGIDSSLFMVNCGATLTTFLAALLFWPLSCGLSKLRNHRVAGYFYDASTKYKWNFFIRFVIEGYLDLLLAALFQLQFASAGSFNIIANCAVSVFALLVCLGAPVLAGVFIYRHKHRFNDEEEKALKKYYGSLFEEFKNDQGFLSCIFYVLFFLRRLSYVIILYCLEAFPVVQVGLNVVHSVASALFVGVYRPFTEKSLNISSLYSEVCISITFSLSGLYLLDLSSSSRVILQWLVLGVVYSMMLVNIAVSTMLSIKGFKELWQKWRRRYLQNKSRSVVLE
jgi:hypothetical protein